MSKWFCTADGKKTALGAVVLILPTLAQQIAEAMGSAGSVEPAATIIQVVGIVTIGVGLAHKFLKKLDPTSFGCF